MTKPRHRLEVRNTAGELWERFPGEEVGLREQAETMATVHGQKSWKFDLYEGGTLKATYKRGVWTEHAKEKAP